MTFLVFLISLVVIERILRRAESGREASPGEASQENALAAAPAEPAPAQAPGLITLGEAIGRFGCGQAPEPGDSLEQAGAERGRAER